MSPRRAIPVRKQRGLPAWAVVGAVAIVLIVVLVVGIDFVAKTQVKAPIPASASAGDIPRSGRTEGDPNAPIELVVFSDYQCPYCRDYALGPAHQIENNYVKTGKVKVTHKYYPILDGGRVGESEWAAEAAECANRQGSFWEYHDRLFSAWAGENVGTFAKAKLKQYAQGIVPDVGTFGQCLDADQTASIVQADRAEGTRLGIRGTPTFFANGRMLQVVPTDYSSFSRAFDSILK